MNCQLDSGPEKACVQELERIHKCTVAEASVLGSFSTATVAHPRNLKLGSVTSHKSHRTAVCPITKVAQDAYYSARGVIYLPNNSKATVDWFLESEQKEVIAAALKTPVPCNSLPPRAASIVILAGHDCLFVHKILDAVAHLASARCGNSVELNGMRAASVSEAAKTTRIGFLSGDDALRYLTAHATSLALSPTEARKQVDPKGASIALVRGTAISKTDVILRASIIEFKGTAYNCSNDDLVSQLQQSIAKLFSLLDVTPPAELFLPMPPSSKNPFLDHTAAIHNEFFTMLMAPPDVYRASTNESDEPMTPLVATDVHVRFVPKNVRCENPFVAHSCFHGILACHQGKEKQLMAFLTEARQNDRNPIYGIGAPNEPRNEGIGIHVVITQAHPLALEANVTCYGLLGDPGKRIHRDGNFLLRLYRQLFALTPKLLEQHFILPCSFQSCIPVDLNVARPYFAALEECKTCFAEHFGDNGQEDPAYKSKRIEAWEFCEASAEESAVTSAIGLGFGCPAMRIGHVLAHITDAQADVAPDALVGLLVAALARLGPSATVFDAFQMAREVVNERDKLLETAETEVKRMTAELEKMRVQSPEPVHDSTGSTSRPTTPRAAGIHLGAKSRDRLVASLGLVRGQGSASYALPLSNSRDDTIAAKLTKMAFSACGVDKPAKEATAKCRQEIAKCSQESSMLNLVTAAARVVLETATDRQLVIGCVPRPTDGTSEALTCFYHVEQDGGVRETSLSTLLELEKPSLLVVVETPTHAQCFYYCQKVATS